MHIRSQQGLAQDKFYLKKKKKSHLEVILIIAFCTGNANFATIPIILQGLEYVCACPTSRKH